MTTVSETAHLPRFRRPGRAKIEAARAELATSQVRASASDVLVEQAVTLARRLNGHRQDNHFRQRIESLYRETR